VKTPPPSRIHDKTRFNVDYGYTSRTVRMVIFVLGSLGNGHWRTTVEMHTNEMHDKHGIIDEIFHANTFGLFFLV